MLAKYAHLLCHYCLELQPGDRLFIQTTTLAEPLVREVYRAALRAGAHVEIDMAFAEKNAVFMQEANEVQLSRAPDLYVKAMEEYEAYLHIRAPFNLREDGAADPEKSRLRAQAMAPVNRAYFQRTATRSLKRTLCQYPTQAAAQEAGMSLSEYEQFVYGACRLYDADPAQAWLDVRAEQQRIVDFLNRRSTVRYKAEGTDLTFSTAGRTWINSDGQTNMPSGEVYTSPVEDSAEGVVHFSYPSIYQGQEAEDVALWVKSGHIERWEARRGMEFLNQIFQTPGARRFGEAAIGTNYRIDRITRNILFDEKIGGSVHLAVGQSYLQTGGKNESVVHWDMITDMTREGEIFADGELIYKQGKFLI